VMHGSEGRVLVAHLCKVQAALFVCDRKNVSTHDATRGDTQHNTA
jgi:hypothetical protein